MLTIQAITDFFEVHQTLGYICLFLGVIIEGEFTLLISGILAYLGAFDYFIAYTIGMGGAVGKTMVGYSIGRLIKRKYPRSRFFQFVIHRVKDFLPEFEKNAFWSIFLSKFILGINHFVLVYCGFRKVNRNIFYKAEIFSSLFWVLGFLSLGYFFSFAAFSISHDLRKFTLIILAFLIGFVFLQRLINFILEIYEARKHTFEEVDEE